MKPETTNCPENFELHEKYALYLPVAVVSLERAASLIGAAIIYARKQAISKLLVDARGLTGFPSPSLADRYWIVREWAGEALDLVDVALVLQPYLIDPERFGVVVAWNQGMRADVFTEVQAALTWLLSDAKPFPLEHR